MLSFSGVPLHRKYGGLEPALGHVMSAARTLLIVRVNEPKIKTMINMTD
jgi:hypothetical protein